jgi:hypothetical protein
MEDSKMEILTETTDFRTYVPEILKDAYGSWVVMQQCEALEEGRWEPFMTVIGRCETKAEAWRIAQSATEAS